MKYIAYVAAFSLLAATCVGQAETTSFNASIKGGGSASMTPQGEVTDNMSQQGSVSHTFTITPAQEEMLTNDGAVIALDGFETTVEFELADDPKYTAGSKSVKIKQIINEPEVAGTADISAKWGKGQMTVSAKLKLTGDLNLISRKPGKLKSTKVPGHPASTTEFRTIVVSTDDFVARGFVSYSLKESQSRTIKADGSQTISVSIQAKSAGLVDEPVENDL